ncbi:MAG TPA: response regulator [Myxococcota bacterium]|jgi:two-component system chemotaxis response regulator CheY|nr:response regulator [Myxococcota bacterium]
MKVLVVDDSAIMRKVIEQILEMLGHEAVPAANGVEAFDRLKEHDDVQLILLDWNMPEMNGIEFLRAVKDRPGLSKIPVIMLTTESERRKMIEAIEAGAKHYLTKPFQPETLATKILQCVETGS